MIWISYVEKEFVKEKNVIDTKNAIQENSVTIENVSKNLQFAEIVKVVFIAILTA